MRRSDPNVHEVDFSGPLPRPAAEIVDALTPHLTPERKRRIEEVVSKRTLAVRAVLENVADPHNASAVFRSADAFGVHRVEVVDDRRALFAARKVAKGSERWLEIVRHESAEACTARLREDGFRIYVAAMDGELCPEDLVGTGNVAVVFGNEHHGVSEGMRAAADGTFAIPMRGFVESLNVSVAAAITLHVLAREAPRVMDEGERLAIVARLMMATVRDAARIVAGEGP